MDDDKSVLDKITDTVKAAVSSIAHPTAGTPMEMPLNESRHAITHLKATPRSRSRKKITKKPAKKPAKKSKRTAGRTVKKTARKVARKGKAKR